MELLKINIQAGASVAYERTGGYFEIIDSTSPINIDFYDRDGSNLDDMIGAVSGMYAKVDYSRFIISSSVAQSVQVLISDKEGGSRRQPGNVTIIDSVSDNCQTAGSSNQTLTAFAAASIVAQASNINGVLIRGISLEVMAGAAGVSDSILVARKVTPAAPADVLGSNTITLGRIVDSAGVRQFQSNWDLRKKIPPGYGIFHCTINSVAANANACRVSFEVM